MGGPSFIHIINNYHVQQEEIRIPQGFVTEYGDDLSDHAVFIVPSGIEWFVEIKRDSNSDDGGVYFKKGLNELFGSYSITSVTFLVFKYEGISQFNVRICQLSGEEVDCSSFHNNDTDDYYVEASDEAGDNDDSEDDSNDEEREEFRDGPVRKKNRSITRGGLRTQERAIEIEKGFKSLRNNPFFTIGLQPSYVSHKFLPIPANFEGKEELWKLENIRLDVVPNGGSWIVFLITMGRGQGIRFSKGVPRFLKDNNLKEGDVCLFEMVAKKKSGFYEYARVHIFRSWPSFCLVLSKRKSSLKRR
ncbi:hypothetical protein MKW98_029374 [Papaver atlanticum]|uniref:TF-B3 domain-containing protein n=1 Tax=Papaver atlanticum TaxID=357466 RepID=A0AAD4SI03_9MAGN|nr:hypothetical protein MKW98_029374 [Papaver atlanticum]